MSVSSSPQTPRPDDGRLEEREPETFVAGKEAASRLGRLLDERFRRLVFCRLENLTEGRLAVIDGDETHLFGRCDSARSTIELQVLSSRFYRRLALGGSFAAGEAYISGDWKCDELVELMSLFLRDEAFSARLEGRFSRLTSLGRTIAHRMRRNTPVGSRRNISAHYDLGDDFFSLFLDDTMAYSCGIFPTPRSTLREASLEKFDRVCRKLRLRENDHVVEIGSGWGGFAVYAARNYGCRVTTTTISARQLEFTRDRVKQEGLAERITVLGEDYRNLTGHFDKLVSIEMIEAVGYEYFDTFFGACSKLLKPDGVMLLQAITIPDQRFDRYRRSVDFLQQYIFPGGCLPSIGEMCKSLGRATDMRVVHLEDLTAHYAQTLDNWRHRFRENIEKIRDLGFSEAFVRLWEFYFCYCEAGFRERTIADVQLLLCKPRCRREQNSAPA